MSNVFTVTTELKLNKEYNQLVSKYISDYIKLFNKIQRLTFHRIKNYYIKNGKITQEDRNIIHSQLKEEFDLTSRAIDAILSNMLGRYESIKELKEYVSAGVNIFNVSGGADTVELVKWVRSQYPDMPIIASGGKTEESILKTIEAGANAITYTAYGAMEKYFHEKMETYRTH